MAPTCGWCGAHWSRCTCVNGPGVGHDRGRSDDKRGDSSGQQTVMSGAPDGKPDEAVSTVTAGETAIEDDLQRVLRAADAALSEAREMLGVFEDHGGHDGLNGKAYLATVDHMDEARKSIRVLLK